MFFSAQDGREYAVSSVLCYWHQDKDLLVKLVGHDAPVKAYSGALKALERAGSSYIPASANTTFIGILDDNGAPSSVWFSPIIGWMVGSMGASEPITHDGVTHGVTNDYAVLHPNGQVSRFEHNEYPSLMAFLDELDLPDPALEQAMKDARDAHINLR